MALKHRREFAGSSTLQGSSSTPTRSETDNLIDHSGSQAANGSRRHRSQSASENLDILVNHVLIHRSPPTVTRSLRYLLAQGELPHRLSLTSSLFGEGVTAMSRSLASLIAYDWRESTCWVDLNWWKVGATDPATSPFEVTIAGVREGAGTVADLPVATSIPALSMVGAGEVPPGSRARLPRSDALADILDELARSFDYLVLDLPPVLASSDAVALSRLSEGYLLVVQQRSTSSTQVRAAMQTMNMAPCLGTILNGTRSHLPRWLRTSNEVWALGS